jgi:hypothetical protein
VISNPRETFQYIDFSQDSLNMVKEILVQHGSIIEANCRLLRSMEMLSVRAAYTDEVVDNGK